jgi:hypothetical protein
MKLLAFGFWLAAPAALSFKATDSVAPIAPQAHQKSQQLKAKSQQLIAK